MKRYLRKLLPALLLLAPLAAAAQIVLLPPCTKSGNCGITDILAVFVNMAEYLLGISGAVALGFFVYGGVVFILSRGSKGEVDKAFGILRSAVIGIAIIFLSGVLIRFTTQALTGGKSKIASLGETCTPKGEKGASGIWLSIPPGIDQDGKPVPEGLVCIKKVDGTCNGGACDQNTHKCNDGSPCGEDMPVGTPCTFLNKVLGDRGRYEVYACLDVSTASSCVRGLCANLGAAYACCIK